MSAVRETGDTGEGYPIAANAVIIGIPLLILSLLGRSFGLDGMCARWLAVYKLDHRLVEGCVLYSSLVLRFPSPASP